MDSQIDITQFLIKNRIEELQLCFTKHKINIQDLNIWTEQDAKEYCIENGFGTHIKRRLINAISKLQSDIYTKLNKLQQQQLQSNSMLHSIYTKINKLQQQQLQSDIDMKNCFTKISKQNCCINDLITKISTGQIEGLTKPIV